MLIDINLYQLAKYNKAHRLDGHSSLWALLCHIRAVSAPVQRQTGSAAS